jgi:SAM-dependent methyltransferase
MLAVVALAAAGAAFLALRSSSDQSPGRSDAIGAPAPDDRAFKTSIPYSDARTILETFRDRLPADLRGKAPADLEAAWPGWVERHNAEIRARLERGDEDSIINLWLYGTSFTERPRATTRDLAALGGRDKTAELLQGRLDDLLRGLAAPGANERLQFARRLLERRGIDPSTPAGKDKAWDYLDAARLRMVAENDRLRKAAESARRITDGDAQLGAYSTLYRDRGLSSDTSIRIDFAIERSLDAAKSKAQLGAGSIRRVAIVGPGLDFADKTEGHDFYPLQTIQPFALIDSLVRLGLARPEDVRLTTLDVSPRVNDHLDAARERAARGVAYELQLPLDNESRWTPDLVAYWQRIGSSIGEEAPAIAAPPNAGAVRVRAIRVSPAIVRSIVPRDVNIVLERLDPLAAGDQFDLIVATNILVYYDAFDQALALANVSRMLRPGGFLVTNYVVFPTPPIESPASLVTKVEWDEQHNGDTLFWYRRR